MPISQTTSSTAVELPVAELRKYLKKSLSRKRFNHSLRVAETAAELCRSLGCDEFSGYFAGLGHDLAREWKHSELLELAPLDGYPVEPFERQKPLLLHGRVASIVLARDFGVEDMAILSAVRHHTLGAPGLPRLAKILFLADYLEPGRKYLDQDRREQIRSLDIDRAVVAVIEDSAARWGRLAESTQAMYDEIRSESIA